MKYPAAFYRKAEAILSARRHTVRADLAQRRETLRRDCPEIWALHLEIRKKSAQLGAVILSRPEEERQALIDEHLVLAGGLHGVLGSNGLAPDYLEPRPFCPHCYDKGFIDGHSCVCRDRLLNRFVYEMLSDTSRVEECSFDSFDLGYYTGDTRKTMAKLLEACRRYAADFTCNSPNLLFMGPTGLGKTHLSLAIAREVVNHGKLVLYVGAEQLLTRIIGSKMGNASQDEYRDIAYGCDLLIIDDLGTELRTRLTPDEVYSLINTRIIEGRPSIINTNLSLEELENAYGQRVVSRLAGCYSANRFDGKDIRLQKRRKSAKGG